jgi:hypothetical protein
LALCATGKLSKLAFLAVDTRLLLEKEIVVACGAISACRGAGLVLRGAGDAQKAANAAGGVLESANGTLCADR